MKYKRPPQPPKGTKITNVVTTDDFDIIVKFACGEEKMLNLRKYIDEVPHMEPLERLFSEVELFKNVKFWDTLIYWDEELDISVAAIWYRGVSVKS